MNTAFREAVKKAMEEKETNPTKVARQIDMMPSYVLEVLKGQKRLNETMEEKICSVLDIDIQYKIKRRKKRNVKRQNDS